MRSHGGKLVIKAVTRNDIVSITTVNDLVIIAAGKGKITAQLFERDAEKSIDDRLQCNLALITITGTKPWLHTDY